ncbi:MAG: fucose isomerase [Spirochaetia bacterium]|jgi:L-fucose isomerase-like protein
MLEYYRDRYKVRLGFLPTRRNLNRPNLFNRDYAIAEKNKVEEYLKANGIDYVNLDFLNEEGLLFRGSDAEKVVERFQALKVNALFAPHCNFGTEDAVAKVAQKLSVPLLLWGPRDDAPEAGLNRTRDSQCGLFATSRVLKTFGVPFSYITNSRVVDQVFKRGLSNFLAAAAIVGKFRAMRIGQIGIRPASFWSVKANEAELFERFGIEVVPIAEQDVRQMMDAMLSERPDEVASEAASIRSKIDSIKIGDDSLNRIAAMKLAVREWAKAESLDAAAVSCGGAMRKLTGIMPCFVLSELTDDGFPAICETDLHGCVTAVLTQAAAGAASPVFLADMTVRHPENDNAELLWHCGVFPHSLKKEGTPSAITDHYGSGIPGAAKWEIKRGGLTITRFDGTMGDYRLLATKGRVVDGPETNGTYAWVEFKDWPELEHRLIFGPYIHHCVGIYADVTPVFFEASRYMPGVSLDLVDPTPHEIERLLRG